ncbi:hypothetical protein F5X68DRAFT_208678 [Plectosphaerella plurivora]|uniref:Uncharacterized protein n=1 Tax=Plectosphaerella plurivora TaxID=936078 RepID=A0A9P8VAQ5_9PEZI|nr:hypothetical protein F5X68DRAFT_208678 [Plectosphaerella plurivora]
MPLITSLGNWMHRKKYQFEVTFCVYIFTPWEKFIFYTLLFLLVGLTFIATALYLPQHIAFIVGRAWFYMHGENVDVVELTKEVVGDALAHAPGFTSEAAETLVKEL